MKIDGPNSTRSTSSSKKTEKGGRATSGAFAAMMDGASEANVADNVPTSAPLSGIDALLAMQGVDDATTSKNSSNTRAKAWGEDLLDRLDEIRTGLLLGTIPPHQLVNLSNLLTRQKAAASDPKLKDVISEIEVRALVELAKFQREIS